MLGPKQTNKIEDGSGNTQMGDNSGSVTIGLTFEQHQKGLNDALAEKTRDLERAHTAEKALIQSELDALRARMSNLPEDYEDRLEELRRTKEMLKQYENRIAPAKMQAAYDALDKGDLELARELFTKLAAMARNRREDAAIEEAKLEFELGNIAETEVRWLDAAEHFSRAADLDPSYDNLKKAGEYLWRAGQNAEAIRCEEKLVTLSTQKFGEEDAKTATALNNLAGSFWAMGRYEEAEPLYREALEIALATIGEVHPDYAARLNNLAELLRVTGRYDEAEPLYREALEIGRKTIGEAHSNYAVGLNNLGTFHFGLHHRINF